MEKYSGNRYIAVIGLEVHAQLLTESKIFCADSTQFGAQPNTNVSVISLGHPGSLPKLNRKTVELAIKMGLACNCEIARETFFDRKNYFYPDLPKGYQITQDRRPVCTGGYVNIRLQNGLSKKIHLIKIHLEEDAGKSIHLAEESDTLVDLNRAGMPLIEIVTEPDLRSSAEAAAFLTEVRKIVRYLDICDGNMEEGSLRCDANVSVMLENASVFGSKVEVKNMNSIRNVQRAIDYEIDRQIKSLEAGIPVISETRLFDADSGTTAGMRKKETLTDYRYFPEPDLSPLYISDEWLNDIKSTMSALPGEVFNELTIEYGLPHYDATILTESKELANFFLEAAKHTKNHKSLSNWMMTVIKGYLNETGTAISSFPIKPEQIGRLINMVDERRITHTAASQMVFPALIQNQALTPEQVVKDLDLVLDDNTFVIEKAIEESIQKNPGKVREYKKGKKGLIGFFMGELMRLTQGKADPILAQKMLKAKLEAKD